MVLFIKEHALYCLIILTPGVAMRGLKEETTQVAAGTGGGIMLGMEYWGVTPG